jgi:hypothetical protein
MATAYRSSQSVTNGTAGTSVTVAKPAGIVDTGSDPGRDHLVAFIAATGAPTMTPPAGWTLVTSAVDGGSNVTLWCYRKLASSEGASWTWTLGTSKRNWGWVGAYTGVDPTSPVTDSSTDLTLTSGTTLGFDASTGPDITGRGQGVSAGAGVRTASGTATTWTHTSTERADLSTNAGAGTDIAGVVGDVAYASDLDTVYVPTATASQSQAAGVMVALTLNAYFVPYTGAVGGAGVVLEAAFGVDPDSDSAGWTWTDLTSYVHHPASIVHSHGRSNRSALADPSRLAFTLLNVAGEFTHPAGAYAQYMVQNLPFRLRLTGFGKNAGGPGFHRATAFLASARPRWDESTNFAVVDVVAQGRLRRYQQRTEPLRSAAYRTFVGITPAGSAPVAYWPFEDGSGATSAASAVAGVPAAVASGFTFGANSSFVGSAPVAQFTASVAMVATVPLYTPTGAWLVGIGLYIPSEPAGNTTLLRINTSGTASVWEVILVPGTSALHLRAYNAAVGQVLDDSFNPTESGFYGHAIFVAVLVSQSGADIDYELWYYTTGDTAGAGFIGTLAGYTHGNVTSTTAVGETGPVGAGYGHLVVYADPSMVGSPPTELATALLEGNAGEWPWARFQRLCVEEGIPYTVDQSGTQDLTMGPQGVRTLVDLLRECETAEGCVLNDSGEEWIYGTGRTGQLWFPARDDRDNISATMTLAGASGQIAPRFEPVRDDQDIVNDVEVKRVGGSSARVVDEESVAREGRYKESVSVNIEDDSLLSHLAGNRVNLGTVRGMRFPAVAWNLRRSPDLAEQWLNCRLSHRVDITGPPAQYPPDDIQVILEGFTETLSMDGWTVRGYLSPYRPYKVFMLAETTADAGEYVGRLAGDPDAALRVAVSSSATSFEIDPNRCRFTTVADDFDPDIRVRLGGELVDVSAISTTAATFVAAGTAAHADNASVTPGMPAGTQARDLLLVFAAIRNSGTGTVNTPAGYTSLLVFGNCALFGKVHSGSEVAPTVSFSGGVAGATTSAQMAAFRGTPSTLDDLADIVVGSVDQLNASAANIAYPGIYPRMQEGCIVLALGWRQQDWTSVATLSGFAEIGDPASGLGDNQGLVWDYVIQTTPSVVNEGSFSVTGGVNGISRGAVVALAGGYQTFTVAHRSLNGVTKSHSANTRIEVEDAFALGL